MSDGRCDLLCLDAPRAEAIRERLLDEETAFGAAGRARAFADPTRLTLASALGKGGKLCVCDLAWISLGPLPGPRLPPPANAARPEPRPLPPGRQARLGRRHAGGRAAPATAPAG